MAKRLMVVTTTGDRHLANTHEGSDLGSQARRMATVEGAMSSFEEDGNWVFIPPAAIAKIQQIDDDG